jgi:hypothetical protein
MSRPLPSCILTDGHTPPLARATTTTTAISAPKYPRESH